MNKGVWPMIKFDQHFRRKMLTRKISNIKTLKKEISIKWIIFRLYIET